MTRLERARRRIEERIYTDAVGRSNGPRWKQMWPLLTEHGYASRVIRKRLGLPTPLNTTDRIILEQSILPFYVSQPDIRTVLFVGCSSYTVQYQRQFFSRVNFWTIEPDATRARYGSNKHVIAPLENLEQHFAANTFDLIICNGVYGWGLDRPDQLETAFRQCHACLRSGGYFLLGWDDIPERAPVALDSVSSLQRFNRHEFPVLGTWRLATDTPYRHTFDFYRK